MDDVSRWVLIDELLVPGTLGALQESRKRKKYLMAHVAERQDALESDTTLFRGAWMRFQIVWISLFKRCG